MFVSTLQRHNSLFLQGQVKKKPEGLKRQTLKIISTLPRLNGTTNARTKKRLELLQSDGKKHNPIGCRSIQINAEWWWTLMNRNADSRRNIWFKNEKINWCYATIAAVPKPKGNGINDGFCVWIRVYAVAFWLLGFSYVWLCTIAGAAINFAEDFILTWEKGL